MTLLVGAFDGREVSSPFPFRDIPPLSPFLPSFLPSVSYLYFGVDVFTKYPVYSAPAAKSRPELIYDSWHSMAMTQSNAERTL